MLPHVVMFRFVFFYFFIHRSKRRSLFIKFIYHLLILKPTDISNSNLFKQRHLVQFEDNMDKSNTDGYTKIKDLNMESKRYNIKNL